MRRPGAYSQHVSGLRAFPKSRRRFRPGGALSHSRTLQNMKMLQTVAVLAGLGLLAAPVQAKLAWNKKAKTFDAGVTACTSCHVDEKPNKKDHGKPLTPRGQWMVDQKEARKTKEMSLAWLKEYPGNGKDESSTKETK